MHRLGYVVSYVYYVYEQPYLYVSWQPDLTTVHKVVRYVVIVNKYVACMYRVLKTLLT